MTSSPSGTTRSAGTSTRPLGKSCPPGTRPWMRSASLTCLARGPVRGPVRRPGRAGRITPSDPVHRLPDQIPHQTRQRLPPGTTGPEYDHATRLADALRDQPCSPRCTNWLRYGIQPKNARPGQGPGACKGKAHDADHLGYAGRRVLVSRKWSGKTLADHRADRKEWLLRTLGVPATDPIRYAWEIIAPSDSDHMDHARRMLHVVADRLRWQNALSEARRRAAMPPDGDLPATRRAA
jgi:hypothetical protein